MELLNTGKAVLVECIGLSMSDFNRYDRTKWEGQNLLGYSLMLVRSELK
ncbi:MAG: NADAR family protein [Erysipelotrichaceae bacterium]|nr:NADAR family protein [Erysipelotrichaceae bacterium]